MVSGIMMTVGVLGTVLGTVLVPESKAPVSLVVAGIKGEVSTFSAAAAAEADLSRQQAIVKKETMKIAELTAEIALISTASGQLSTFLEKGKATETALLSLVEQWKVLDTQLTTVIDAVNGMSVNDGPFLLFSPSLIRPILSGSKHRTPSNSSPIS